VDALIKAKKLFSLTAKIFKEDKFLSQSNPAVFNRDIAEKERIITNAEQEISDLLWMNI